MFQVASRPTPHFSSPMECYISTSHSQQPLSSSLQLPRSLARPAFSEISRDAIPSVAPELADVPVEYVRRHLAGQANEMLAALSLLTIPSSLPRSRLPQTIDAPIRPSHSLPNSASFPTHVLAISSSRSSPSSPNTPTVASFAAQALSSGGATIPLFPTHALVLAAHCTLLPRLPRSRSSQKTATASLPVVPLSLPSVETFALFHAYLHTKRADTLLAALLPAIAGSLPQGSAGSSGSSGPSVYLSQFTSDRLSRLAHALASTCCSQGGPQVALSTLMAYTKVVNGLWRNVCALGVFDAELWGIMDLAWEIVLAALTRVVQLERS